MRQLTSEELEAGLDTIRQSPADEGVLELIVRRPQAGVREVLQEGELDPVVGLAGDQLFIDMDLSEANLPAGTRLSLGLAVIEVTDQPHTGCGKFVERFGLDAMKFVNSTEHKALHLRGINARVVQPGTIRVGDVVKKLH